MNKVKLKPSYMLLLLVLSVLILLCTHNTIFGFLAFLVCLCAMILMRLPDFAQILFFIMPMASIFKLQVGGTSFLTYIEVIFVIYYYINRKLDMDSGDICVIILGLYMIAIQAIIGKIELIRVLKMMINLWILSIFLEEDCEEQYPKLFISFVLGVITSSTMRFFDSSFFNISAFEEQVNYLIVDGIKVTRFMGLYSDPNYYSVNAIISLILLVFLYYKDKLGIIAVSILSTPLVYFCALTGSKSALLMLAFPILMLLRCTWRKKHYFVYCLLSSLLMLGTYMVLSGRISIFSTTLARMNNAGEDIDSLTTGRSTLWMNYIKELISHPLQILFGNSPSVYLLNGSGAHNTYIDFAFQLGIVGTAIYFSALRPLTRINHHQFKRRLENYSVFITIAIMYLFLSQLQSYDLPFHFALGFICMNVAPNIGEQHESENHQTCHLGHGRNALAWYDQRRRGISHSCQYRVH